MKQQRIEFVMGATERDAMVQFLGEIPGKYCLPLLNMVNAMEQRAVPVEIEDATPRGKRVSGGAA